MRPSTLVTTVAVGLLFAVPTGCHSSETGSLTTGSSTGGSGTGSTSSGGTSGGATVTGGTTTGASIPGLGAACTFNVGSGLDTCADAGLECTSLISWVFCEGLDYPCPPTASDKGGAGTCALPQEIAPCRSQVGCQDAGASSTGESNDLVCISAAEASVCFYACSHSSDCANITESCQSVQSQNVCTYNYCNPDLGGKYFNACDALATGDGQCLSYGVPGSIAAVCYQNGTVASGDACQAYRTNGSGDQQCVFGEFCAPTPADQTVGICMELADGTANHPCSDPTAHLVVDVIGANFGVCAQDCADDAGSCPPNLSCQALPDGKKGCMP